MATRWYNSDGLTVNFGPKTEADKNYARTPETAGARQQITLRIKGGDLEDAVTADSGDVHKGMASIPAGSLIESATLIVETAFTSGGSAVLDIGTYENDGTAIDDDGIDSAIAVASLTDGAVITCDGAQIGAVVENAAGPTGTPLDTGIYVMATYDTSAFTAGEALLVIEYINQARS